MKETVVKSEKKISVYLNIKSKVIVIYILKINSKDKFKIKFNGLISWAMS